MIPHRGGPSPYRTRETPPNTPRITFLDSVHDDFLRCNGEYWPEIGERIQVRRYIYRSPNDEVRLTSQESAMEGLWPALNEIAFRGCVRWRLRGAWYRMRACLLM